MTKLDRPQVLAPRSAPVCSDDGSEPRHDVAWIAERHSVAVKRLGPPAPSADQLDLILRAALTAPDHGALRPWRIIRCGKESRGRIAELFVAGKLRRHPDSTEIQIEREREKAMRPPVLLALIASPKTAHEKVPEAEQIACAGAALQSILIAAHGLGFGAITLSGSRCADGDIRTALGVGAAELLLGFVSIGSIVDQPKLARRPQQSEVIHDFDGERILPLDLSKE